MMDFRIDMDWSSGKYTLRCRDGEGEANPIIFTKHDAGEYVEPIMMLDKGDLQVLINELWRNGIRPSDSPSEVVVNRHLEDMRQIAFATLNIKKPE